MRARYISRTLEIGSEALMWSISPRTETFDAPISLESNSNVIEVLDVFVRKRNRKFHYKKINDKFAVKKNSTATKVSCVKYLSKEHDIYL